MSAALVITILISTVIIVVAVIPIWWRIVLWRLRRDRDRMTAMFQRAAEIERRRATKIATDRVVSEINAELKRAGEQHRVTARDPLVKYCAAWSEVR